MTTEQSKAEQATGCRERVGLGQIFTGPENIKGRVTPGGDPLTNEQAAERLQDGKCIAIPNAGAGSYRKVFCGVGSFQDVRVIDWTSSAGDWCFGVFDGQEWQLAFQENRYPHHRFHRSMRIQAAQILKCCVNMLFRPDYEHQKRDTRRMNPTKNNLPPALLR
jgi:hypothetical protein